MHILHCLFLSNKQSFTVFHTEYLSLILTPLFKMLLSTIILEHMDPKYAEEEKKPEHLKPGNITEEKPLEHKTLAEKEPDQAKPEQLKHMKPRHVEGEKDSEDVEHEHSKRETELTPQEDNTSGKQTCIII